MEKEQELVAKKLGEILPRFEENKFYLDEYKKLVDVDNKEIKDLMLKADLSEFNFEGITAKINVSERAEFVQVMLFDKIKKMNIEGLIKTKEYLDMEALEEAIYHGKINAAELADCQIIKKVVSLRVTSKGGK